MARVYPAATLSALGAVWNIGDQGWVLKNGNRTTGHALALDFLNGWIWVKSPRTNTWWQTHDAQTWTDKGPNDPAGVTPPPGGSMTITGTVPAPVDWVLVQGPIP